MPELIRSCLQQLRSDRWYRALVAVAVFGTLFFFALHAARVVAGTRFDIGQTLFNAGFKAKQFAINIDGSYAEWFEYLILAIIVMSLGRLALNFRRPIYFAFLFIFTYYLADDSLQIHEILGGFLAHRLALPEAFGLRGQDFGEMATWALFGVPLLGFLCFALWRSDGRHRSVGLTLTGWFFVLAFFGLVVDMGTVLVHDQFPWNLIVEFVEDGGEMAVVAVIMALTLAVPAYLREEGVVNGGHR